jgi:hypothetical protein
MAIGCSAAYRAKSSRSSIHRDRIFRGQADRTVRAECYSHFELNATSVFARSRMTNA